MGVDRLEKDYADLALDAAGEAAGKQSLRVDKLTQFWGVLEQSFNLTGVGAGLTVYHEYFYISNDSNDSFYWYDASAMNYFTANHKILDSPPPIR